MGYPLFLLVTVVLFLRPAEIMPDLAAVPLYEWLIVGCLVASLPEVLEQLRQRSLIERPITFSMLGLLAAIFLSHASHFDFWAARFYAGDFLKTVLYYLLLVGKVNSVSRLRSFLFTLSISILFVAALALLQYHQIINLPALAVIHDVEIDPVTGLEYTVPRICGSGVFRDPNDLAMIVVVGMALSLYWLTDRTSGPLRALWLAPLALFFYAMARTESRGGLLALLSGIVVLFYARFGMKKTIPLAALVLPALILAFGGRQASVASGIEDDTGLQRIQLWSAAMVFFREAPLFGIGANRFADEVGLVAHNSFVHCFAELGFLGGASFLAITCWPVWRLWQVGRSRLAWHDDELRRLRPYIMAALAGYAVSMFTLSRCYVVPAYLMPATASAYLRLFEAREGAPSTRIDGRWLWWVTRLSVACLITVKLLVRFLAHWDVSF